MANIKFSYVCPKCGQARSYTPESLKVGRCRNEDCKALFSPEQLETIHKGIEEVRNDRKFTQVKAKL
jgi:hypothetical protein